MSGARILRLAAVPPDLTEFEAAARGDGFGIIATLRAEGFAPYSAAGCALFEARDGAGALLGIGGMTQDPWATGLRMRRFYVRPEARRGGLGRALAMAVLEHARAGGARRVRLRAPAAAFAFWEACGFVPVEEPQATHALWLLPRAPG